jgi:parallel beta-helix repeat protein
MSPSITDLIKDHWDAFVLYLPFGIIGAWRWSWWLFQKILVRFYRSTPVADPPFRATLSIVTPVYNEDPQWFGRVLESWRRNGPDEIVAIIDASDRACIETFERFARGDPTARLVITDEPGKRPALARGILAARGEIVALADSDTLWEDGIRDALLAPFSDNTVGGVGPRQKVAVQDTLARALFGMRLDLRYLHEMPYLAAVGDALTCLSGRTALYRRHVLLPLLDDLVHETFWGKPCVSGDDKRLTSLVQAAGWKVRFQQHACVRTPGVAALGALVRQYVRWGRNSWRTDLKMLGSGWIWRRGRWLALHLLDRFVHPFTLMLGPIALGLALFFGHWTVAGAIAAWWLASRAVKLLPHLREQPQDVLLLPVYVLSTYVFVVLRVYALLTLNRQGWITRWHRERLPRFSFFRQAAAYGATAVTVGSFLFGVAHFRIGAMEVKEAERREIRPPVPFVRDIDVSGLRAKRDRMLADLNARRSAVYVMRGGDTLQAVRDKYNIPAGRLGSLYPRLLSSVPGAAAGVRLDIPVADLRNTLPPEDSVPGVPSPVRPWVFFDAPSGTVRIEGSGSRVTLAEVGRTLRDTNLLEDQGGGAWYLKADLYVSEGVTLTIDGNEVSWLKLRSDPGGFVSLSSYNGNMLIRNTRITSWDEAADGPDLDYSDGRSFVLARANGRMDIVGSELAYLGYPRSVHVPGKTDLGGIYGVSWKLPNGTFGRALITGNVVGNRIHDNYFGLYMFGATGMVVRDNEVYRNVQYGIDPHDDSNLLLIENNFVHDNGNHGIIVSKRVVDSVIRDNRSVGNRLHGIMLDRQSNGNLVEGNTVSGNTDGLAIYDSHANLVRGNRIENNRRGIRVNMNGSDNYFEGNALAGNGDGIYLYGGAHGNYFDGNAVSGSGHGFYAKQATDNYVFGAVRFSGNRENVRLDQAAYGSTFIQPF